MTSAAEHLRLALVQMTTGEDIQENTHAIGQSLRALAGTNKPDIVLFPENALFFRVQSGVKIPHISVHSPEILQIQSWVNQYDMVVHLGSVPFDDNGVLRNSTLIFEPNSTPTAPYHKIHLFDVDLYGQKPIRESDVFAHGQLPYIWEYGGFRFGLSICYDLRFAELFNVYARQAVDAILIPSAFTVPTGIAHWHLLMRARAVESQAYVLAAAQGGTHIPSQHNATQTRVTYGHSLAVDPWGDILWDADDVQQISKNAIDSTAAGTVVSMGEVPLKIGIVKLTKQRLQEVRGQIPMSSHRRL